MERHVLGGRAFLTVQESTVEQDFIFLTLIKQAGIDEVVMAEGEDAGEFARRILEATVKGGKALELLGCLLVPEKSIPKRRWGHRRIDPGEIWTPELARETAEYIGSLRTREDKAKINSLVLSLLLSFFSTGIVSLWTSQTSYSEETVPDPERTETTDPGSTTGTDSGPT